MSESDDSRLGTSINEGIDRNEGYHLFNASLDEDVSSLLGINWTWEGHGEDGAFGIYLYFWNYDREGWDNCTAGPISPSSDVVVSCYTTNQSYFNNGVTTFLVYGTNNLDNNYELRTDFVNLQVNYAQNISDCGFSDWQEGETYYLDNDVSSTGTCFEITADNVMLDGNGFSIDGSDSWVTSGVKVNGRVNVTILNMNISDFQYGVSFTSTDDSSVSDSVMNSNFEAGIYFSSSDDNNIINNTVSDGQYGILFYFNSEDNNLINNTLSDNSHGVYLFQGSSSNYLIDNTANSNDNGIVISFNSDDNTLINNVANDNQHGISLRSQSSGNVLLDNELVGNENWAIHDLTEDSYINYLVYNNSYGEIRWTDDSIGGFLRNLTIEGDLTFPGNITIADNFVEVVAEAFGAGSGINSSANITLYDYPGGGFVDPLILRNGLRCEDICYNFTSLTGETVVFNVSYWTNYSIGGANFPSVILNAPANASEFRVGEFNITLNASVYDHTPGDTIDVMVYGISSDDESDFYRNGLLYQELGVANGTEVSYNWTSPVIVPDVSTVLLLHFDNRSEFGEDDTIVFDFSGYGNDASRFGEAMPVMTGGKVAGAWDFDGTDDYLTIPYSVSLDVIDSSRSQNLSIFAWINYSADFYSTPNTIFSQEDDTGGTGRIWLTIDRNSGWRLMTYLAGDPKHLLQ
ncbi:MAG: NosD domain-containing protein, partial [Nanoarchaeota archaeon]